MQLSIPIRDGNNIWHRRTLEKWIRTNVLSKGHGILMRLAGAYGLDPLYIQSVSSCVLIHWILDKVIQDSPKSSEIKCAGEKMGLVSNSLKRTNQEEIKKFKIKGVDDPRADLSQFNNEFTDKLAHFIGHGWAEMPTDQEGVDIDLLERLLGVSVPAYQDVPSISSGNLPTIILPPSIPSEVPLPGPQKRDPMKKGRIKRVVDLQDIENLKADITNSNENISRLNGRLDGHENRLVQLELEIRRRL